MEIDSGVSDLLHDIDPQLWQIWYRRLFSSTYQRN